MDGLEQININIQSWNVCNHLSIYGLFKDAHTFIFICCSCLLLYYMTDINYEN